MRCCSVLQCVVVCCSVLQCVAVCCSVLQRVTLDHNDPTASSSCPSFHPWSYATKLWRLKHDFCKFCCVFRSFGVSLCVAFLHLFLRACWEGSAQRCCSACTASVLQLQLYGAGMCWISRKQSLFSFGQFTWHLLQINVFPHSVHRPGVYRALSPGN